MARSQTAATPAPAKKPAATKAHRPTRRVTKKAPVAAVEFSPAAHHEEIAIAAYLLWLEQGGSSEQNWLIAEAEVRTRYQ
jgi:hypothetical protein